MAAGSTYTPIATYTVSSPQNSYSFTSFSGYTDLKLVVSAIAQSTAHHIFIRFNTDTGSNYSWTVMGGDGSTATSARASNQTEGRLTYFGAVRSGSPTQLEANIMNYSNASTYKTVISRNGRASDGTEATVNLWRSTSAITQFELFTASANNFGVGSTFTLYGIAAA